MKQKYYWILGIVVVLAVIGMIFIINYTKQPIDKITGKGFLEGKISIGPICPVQTIPPAPECQPTEETYKAWRIAIYTSDGKTKIAKIEPDLDGSYKIELPVGNYIVNFEPSEPRPDGVGGNNLPATITINSGEKTILDIDIDTGIR